MKTMLVTGGSGFIGSNFIKYCLQNTEYKIINYDALTYAGNPMNLDDIARNPRYSFIKGNICDEKALYDLFSKNEIDIVVNFAAESHVDRSITDPSAFVMTNVLGTEKLLSTAMKFWKSKKDDKYSREYKPFCKFVQISTDEVYGSLGAYGAFSEETPLCPNSPYSASKASGDLVTLSYYKTFGLPVTVTRCSNNYGPYQFPEKLIPLMINNCLAGRELPIYGDGLQVRDWIHVDDHCRGILSVIEKGRLGEVYNLGGGNERTNIEIVEKIIDIIKAKTGIEGRIKHVKDRPGHDRRYAIDGTKIKEELGFMPEICFDEGVLQTVSWYLENRDWCEKTADQKYLEYYRSMYENMG